MARYRRRADRSARPTSEAWKGSAEPWLPACAVARHGRIQFMSGSSARDLRQDHALPYPARARFDRSRPGQIVRASDRYSKDAFHRFEQVRQYARTQHLQTIFFRADKAGRGRGEGWKSLHGHHRSRIENAAGRRNGSVSAYLLRTPLNRRAGLVTLGFRRGAPEVVA